MTTPPISSPHARPASAAGSRLLVIAGGLLTTVAALGGVTWLAQNSDDFQVMGWYWLYVVPIGAMLIGAVASSGYGLASWRAGVKISGGLLVGIVALQSLAYFVGQYLEFRAFDFVFEDGSPVPFATYFDTVTRSYAFSGDEGEMGAALGVWGYGLRVLEVLGFAAGSLAAPALLGTKAYCEACSVYMRDRQTALLAASVPAERIRKKDGEARAAHEQEQTSALEEALAHAQALGELAQGGDAAGFAALLTERLGDKKATDKLPARIAVELAECHRCEAGELRVQLRTGQGQDVSEQRIGQAALARHFVRTVLQSARI